MELETRSAFSLDSYFSQQPPGGPVPAASLRQSESSAFSLLSRYPSPEAQGRLVGQLALHLQEGEPPSKTSVQPPKIIELDVNLGLARKYGLKAPMAVLNSATRVTK